MLPRIRDLRKKREKPLRENEVNMRINEHCIGCLACLPYCPQGAIKSNAAHEQAFIDEEACVECGVCLDTDVCPADALEESQKEMALVKQRFGRLVASFPGGDKAGRSGGDGFDVKRNDVTRNIPRGIAAVRLEINRPVGGVKLGDIEAMRMFLINAGWKPDVGGRYRHLLEKGFTPEVLDQKVLTAYFEMKLPPEELERLIGDARTYLEKTPLWASVNIACLGETYPLFLKALAACGMEADPVAKFNLGLGRKAS